MERRVRAYDPDQLQLLPRSVQEFVPEGHLAHFVREVVRNELNLGQIESQYEGTRGGPPHNPEMMTAILLYGFTQGVYSARKLSRACEERLDFMAVSASNKPRFRAIAEFRKRHMTALGELFLQVIWLCQKANLINLGHVALDGTKMKANASKQKNKKYKDIKEEEAALKNSIEEWLKKGLAADEAEDEEYGDDQRGDELPDWVKDKDERRKRLQAAREELEREKLEADAKRKEAEAKGEKSRDHQRSESEVKDSQRYNFTDPESAVMRSQGRYVQSYNAQLAVESGSYVIVGCRVSREPNDKDELRPMIKQLQETFNELPQELSADYGYASRENLKILEENDIRGYVALGSEKNKAKKSQRNWSAPETIRMRARFARGGKKSRYRLRMQTVEPIFGILKTIRGFSQFLLRGLSNVEAEWKMAATAHNLRKLHQARMQSA